MNTIKLLLAAVATLGASAAPAQSSVEPPLSLSRAEVKADLHLWQAAGLSTFTTVEAQQLDPKGYQTALARYRASRASAEYPALVKRLQEKPATTLALHR